MARCKEIIGFCDELLDARSFEDYGPNGLQVPGRAEIGKVATGVSAHLELIERSIGADADLLIAHHGLFWEFHPRSLSEPMATRLRTTLESDLNVAGYHLPLDAHPEVGNNALLRDGLGLEPVAGEAGRFGAARGRAIGVIGRFPDPLTPGELERRVAELLQREPLRLGAGPERIERVGLLSGAGAPYLGEAIGLGLDALVSGEPAEHVTAEAREGSIHYFAAGHHATERLGVQRLGELIAERFGVAHEFIEVPNPI